MTSPDLKKKKKKEVFYLHHSSEWAMTKIINDLVIANSNGLPFHLILLDHSVLHNNAETLFSFGFHDILLSCLSSYFCDCSLSSPL